MSKGTKKQHYSFWDNLKLVTPEDQIGYGKSKDNIFIWVNDAEVPVSNMNNIKAVKKHGSSE